MPLARLSSANSPGLIRHEFSPETESPPRGFAALEDVSADVRPTLASWVKETRGGFFKDILEVRKHEVSRQLPNEINSGQGVGLTRPFPTLGLAASQITLVSLSSRCMWNTPFGFLTFSIRRLSVHRREVILQVERRWNS